MPASGLDDYALADRYARMDGQVFLTGTQALLRAVLDQRRRDIEAGLKTAGVCFGLSGLAFGRRRSGIHGQSQAHCRP